MLDAQAAAAMPPVDSTKPVAHAAAMTQYREVFGFLRAHVQFGSYETHTNDAYTGKQKVCERERESDCTPCTVLAAFCVCMHTIYNMFGVVHTAYIHIKQSIRTVHISTFSL